MRTCFKPFSLNLTLTQFLVSCDKVKIITNNSFADQVLISWVNIKSVVCHYTRYWTPQLHTSGITLTETADQVPIRLIQVESKRNMFNENIMNQCCTIITQDGQIQCRKDQIQVSHVDKDIVEQSIYRDYLILTLARLYLTFIIVFKFACMGKFLWSYRFVHIVLLLLVLPLDKPAILDLIQLQTLNHHWWKCLNQAISRWLIWINGVINGV